MYLEEIKIGNLYDAKREIEKIECDPRSIDIMAPKAVFKVLLLRDVNPIDAIIIKQDMLSAGGEVAVPMDVFWRKENCDILIMGTLRHIEDLSKKLNRGYPRLKKVADILREFLEREHERSSHRK